MQGTISVTEYVTEAKDAEPRTVEIDLSKPVYHDDGEGDTGGDEGSQLFVRTLGGRTYTLSPISFSSTVRHVLRRLSEKSDIPVSEMRLIYAGRNLTDPTVRLYALGIQNEATLHLVMRLVAPGDVAAADAEAAAAK